jgi:O-methyltransferase
MSLRSYYGSLAREAGYSVAKGMALPFLRRQVFASGQHAMSFPTATYAPWLTDVDFQRAYRAVRDHTLVDMWRCFGLWQLVAQVSDVPGAILEVGVWRGGTGALMARRAQLLGNTEPVYLCDTWEGVVNSDTIDTHYHDGEHADTSLETVRDLVEQRMGLTQVQTFQGVFPAETGGQLEDRALRFVHIDVDVYRSAADTFFWAWPRLADGGIVVFDDYGFPSTQGVTCFVDEQRFGSDRVFFHNLNGHAIFVKKPA